MDAAIAQPEWDHLARMQETLRSLEGGAGEGGPASTPGRGVRLRLARLAIEERLRADGDECARRRQEGFDQALAALMERVSLRAQAVPLPLALPAPAPPARPAPRRRATPASPPPPPAPAAPAPRRRPASRRARPRLGPPPEFWSPEVVLGFRMWEVRGRLHGAWQAWDRPVYRARCAAGRRDEEDGQVPHTDGRCGLPACGIYAFKEPDQLVAAFGLPEGWQRWVLGLVALSGKVVEHERGYRGQRARVVAAAVVGRGLLVRIEGLERLQCLFAEPEATITGVIATDPAAVEEAGDQMRLGEAAVSYLALARDFYRVTGA